MKVSLHPKHLPEPHMQETDNLSREPVQTDISVCLKALPTINTQWFSLWFSLQLNQ